MTERRLDAVVVGAGIAGLSAAWTMRHRDVLVLEASERLGGRIRSERRGDYWLNWGAHVFGGPGTATGRLIAEARVSSLAVPGRLAAISMGDRLASGRVESYLLRLPLSASERLALARAGLRLREAVRTYDRVTHPRPGETDDDRAARTLAHLGDRSFADFLGRVPPRVDALFRATITRSSAEPEQLAAGHGVGYFHLVWRPGEGLSRNIAGGSSRLIEALAEGLEPGVRRRCRVLSVEQHEEGVRVRFDDGGQEQEVEAEYAVVATPAYEAVAIVRGLPPATADALRAIPYGPFVVVALLTTERGPTPWDGLYAVATPGRSFNMLFNTANVLRSTASRTPGGSLMAYSGGQRLAERLLPLRDDEIVAGYLADLERVLPGVGRVVGEAVVQRWEQALPYPAPGRHRLQPALRQPLGRVFLAGDYLGPWYSETAVQTAVRAADEILDRLESGAAAAGVGSAILTTHGKGER